MYCKFCGAKIEDYSMHQCQQPIIKTEDIEMAKADAKSEGVYPTNKTWEMDSPYSEAKDKRAHQMTKKHSGRSIVIGVVTIALVLLLIVLINFLGLSSKPLFNRTKGNDAYSPERPSMETLLTASPYYMPKMKLPTEVGKNHNENVQGKMQELLEVTDEMMDNYALMQEVVYRQHLVIYRLLKVLDKEVGTHYIEESQALTDLEKLYAEFELQELRYYGLEIEDTGEILYDTDIFFARVVSAVTACEKMSEAYQQQMNISSVLYAGLEETKDDEITALLDQLKEGFESSEVNEYGATMMAGVDTVNGLILSMDMANAYLALSNLSYIEEEMDTVKEQVEDLRKSELVDEAFVELAELMVVEYEEIQSALTDELKTFVEKSEKEIDMGYSMSKSGSDLFAHKTVFAASDDDKYKYGAGYDVYALQKKGQEYMAEQRKAYEEKYKEESYWDTTVRTAKELRKGVQETVENLDAATYEVSRKIAGKFTPSLGNQEEDAYKDIQERYKLAQKRIAEGKGGQEVFKEAVKGFEATQNMAGEGWYNIAAFWEDELGLPQDSVSQLASGMGTLAAESFTQFGQGLARILDPDAKKSDIAKGCLEVATSMVGGSNNIFSATKKGGAVLAKMGEIIASPKISTKAVIDALKSIKEIGIPKLGSSQYKNAAINGTMAILKKSEKIAGKMLKNLDKTFTKDVTRIFTDNWKKSLEGFREYANKVGKNVDDHAVKLIDEFVNGYIDNKVTELASNPLLWDPEVSEKEKEALISSEIDKMNEEIDAGLADTLQQVEEVNEGDLDGKYEGFWTIEDLTGIMFKDAGLSKESVNQMYDYVGRSNPCTLSVQNNQLILTMIGDPFQTNDSVNAASEKSEVEMELVIENGRIIGATSPNLKVQLSSLTGQGKTTISGVASYEVIIEGQVMYADTISFYGEK